MTHATCKLTAKNWDQLRNPMIGNLVWATFTLPFTMLSMHGSLLIHGRNLYLWKWCSHILMASIVYLNRGVARVCCKSAYDELMAVPISSTQITMGVVSATWQLLCFTCMQAVTADAVIAYITHNHWPKISSASSWHAAKRLGSWFVWNNEPFCR